MARAKKIELATGLSKVAEELSKTSTLIGAALRLLTENVETQQALKTAMGTLTRVLDAVDWDKISKGKPEAWLYFYEDFLEVYDKKLRKQTGSYYTPPEVVGAMVSLVDEALRTPRFGLHAGLAASSVTLVDPALGTGTFMLGVLRKIAETVAADEGPGSVKGAVQEALKRLIAFEMQLGSFAVAQLRITAEVVDLSGSTPKTAPRMFVTNTLGNPDDDEGWIPGILAPIAKSRKEANKIKREEPITVVIGNPPYKVQSKGLGGWIEGQGKKAEKTAPLAQWQPLSGGDPRMAAGLGHVYAISGQKDRAQKVIAELKQLSTKRYVAPFEVAVVYMGLGEREQTFEWLEKAYRDHSPWLIWLSVDPRFDGLHGDVRYRDIRDRMGLPL